MKKEKQPGKGPENPSSKTARDRDRRTREQRRAVPTAGQVLQRNTWKRNTWRRTEHSASSQEAYDNWDNKSARDESNVIICTDQKGSCLSPRQRISETRMKPISRRSRPCGLDNLKRTCDILVSCSEELSRRDNKGLNKQDGEVLSPIISNVRTAGESNTMQVDPRSARMILTPVLTVRNSCSGTRAGSLMTVGPMHEETETASTVDGHTRESTKATS